MAAPDKGGQLGINPIDQIFQRLNGGDESHALLRLMSLLTDGTSHGVLPYISAYWERGKQPVGTNLSEGWRAPGITFLCPFEKAGKNWLRLKCDPWSVCVKSRLHYRKMWKSFASFFSGRCATKVGTVRSPLLKCHFPEVKGFPPKADQNRGP